MAPKWWRLKDKGNKKGEPKLNQPPSTQYSESVLTNTTPRDFSTSQNDKQELSKAAMKELLAPLWRAQGDAMKERAEMKLKIDSLENQVENVNLNNEKLADEVERMRIETAGSLKLLYSRKKFEKKPVITSSLKEWQNKIDLSEKTKEKMTNDDQNNCPSCWKKFDALDHCMAASRKCGHILGESCWRENLTKPVPRCPACKRRFSEADIMRVYLLNSQLPKLEQLSSTKF